jgi:hypothetical protein
MVYLMLIKVYCCVNIALFKVVTATETRRGTTMFPYVHVTAFELSLSSSQFHTNNKSLFILFDPSEPAVLEIPVARLLEVV